VVPKSVGWSMQTWQLANLVEKAESKNIDIQEENIKKMKVEKMFCIHE